VTRLTSQCQRTAYTSWQKLLVYLQTPNRCWTIWQLQDSGCKPKSTNYTICWINS